MLLFGLLVPFLGTVLGAAGVFFAKGNISKKGEQLFSSFAAGVMTAAAVWSLLLPSIERSAHPQWLNAAGGFAAGVVFLLLCNRLSAKKGNMRMDFGEKTMLVFAVTLHNIPEGMAVGVAFASALQSRSKAALASAFVLALGIAIQNLPEGAIISLPLKARGAGKGKAFLCGALSGAVEPLAAGITLLMSALVTRLLPFFLAFAAGAMLFVCVDELIPSAKSEENSRSVLGFSAGFLLMMILDVALG